MRIGSPKEKGRGRLRLVGVVAKLVILPGNATVPKGRAKAKQHLNTEAVGHAEAHTSAETVRKDQHHQVRSEACPVFKR